MFIDETNGDNLVSSDELIILRLGHLQSQSLNSNPIFIQLRGKLVSFFKLIEKCNENPHLNIKIDNYLQKRTLFEGLKKLLHVVVLNDDRVLQAQ